MYLKLRNKRFKNKNFAKDKVLNFMQIFNITLQQIVTVNFLKQGVNGRVLTIS